MIGSTGKQPPSLGGVGVFEEATHEPNFSGICHLGNPKGFRSFVLEEEDQLYITLL